MPGAATRRTPAGEQTVERILDEAERLFSERGFGDTSLRDVAREVGIRAPSLYNHFESKDALYSAVLARAFQPMMDVLSGFLAKGDQAYVAPRMGADMIRILSRNPAAARLIHHEALAGGRHMNALLREWVERLYGSGLTAMERTPGEHPWSEEELPLLLIAMSNVITGYFAIAPAFDGVVLEDPLGDAAMRRQAHFMEKLWSRVWDLPLAANEGEDDG